MKKRGIEKDFFLDKYIFNIAYSNFFWFSLMSDMIATLLKLRIYFE